jgi:3'(2'), 5'-bisphosphate nucleotidase
MRSQDFSQAIEAVRAAALFCRRIRREGRIRSMTKIDGSPVTNADFGSQALIVQRLRRDFPNDPIMAEETAEPADFEGKPEFTAELIADLKAAGADFADVSAVVGAINRICPDQSAYAEPNWRRRYWVIDPIDGTKGYLKGGQYAIALALVENGSVVFGALACPEYALPGSPKTIGSIFFASNGEGAFAIPLDGADEPVRLAVGQRLPGAGLVMCESLNHSPHGVSAQVAKRLEVCEADILKMDSQAKYAAVACGDADFYLRLPTSATYREAVWDHAAGAIVVTEAGGKMTDMDGNAVPWTDNRDWAGNHRFAQGRGVVVTNGLLHPAVLTAVAAVTAETGKD